ncbi:MAG: radical SAM protein, partial [Candidatus Omnitrophica bacterium]|nr:radical SAM protein [Candidatus Omnitrophota bacterium]
MEITKKTRFHKPHLAYFEHDGIYFALDGDSPNWIAADERGDWILKTLSDSMEFSQLIAAYASRFKYDTAKSWLHLETFIQDLLRHEMISASPIVRQPYQGRQHYLKPTRLHELWLHTNNSCNLTCAHCLVSSSPNGERGLPLAKLISLVDQASDLGVYRFYITGGEPFIRPDILPLIYHITETHKAEAILLTNATQFHHEKLLGELSRLDRSRLKFQVSIDGADPETNDPIRGRGSFQAAVAGIRQLSPLGFHIT